MELDKVLAKLEEHCISTLGAERVRFLQPSHDLVVVSRRQVATSEADRLLGHYPDLSLGNIYDIREDMARAAVGGLLEGHQLLRVAVTLASGRRLRQFFWGLEGSWPVCREIVGRISDLRHLEKAIEAAIGPDGLVLDQATPKLASLRRQIRKLQERIKERLDSYLRSPEMQKYLQDNLYTVRNDRYVLPVKQEYRQQVPGLVHDQSASGATLFIEPMTLVEINNELHRLQAAEAREIEAILQNLSELVGQEKESLTLTLEALGEIDFTIAKGRLSREMAAQAPRLNKSGRWRISRGRHPLLGGQVVPVSLALGEDFDTLVITGPNTGGKTVTLKTVGLFTLMAQCGLHLPAASGTEIDATAAVYADIGDEQSIEQSLSTFSSHMSQIVSIFKEITPGSLVLLDELGAGTDPTEGAALAMAILDHLTRMGARTVATTHYSELKAYAYATERVENAAVEFDSHTLQPTFKLLIGTPGESNAFAIASRLGLRANVIQRARSLLGEEDRRVSRLISGLTEDKRVSERERLQAEQLRNEAEAMRAEQEKRWQEWQQQAAAQMQKVREEARHLVRRARAQTREIMARLDKELAEASLKEQQKAARKARRQLQDLEDEMETELEKYRPAPAGEPPEDLQVGDKVLLHTWGQVGEVLIPPSDQGEVLVQVGVMKLNVNLQDLRSVTARPKKEAAGAGWTVQVAANDAVSPEINLRGLTVAEACHQVDKYLDDAVLAGLNQVSLIHGKGTGTLRVALQKYLGEHPLVKSFRLGGAGEGGSGVTVVDISR